MKWELLTAKNGEYTLLLNNSYLYSRYRPREDAWKWVESEFDSTKSSYLLIGLGLGYQLEKLVQLAQGKQIYVFFFNSEEQDIYHKFNPLTLPPTVQIIKDLSSVTIDEFLQILIPNVWINALEKNHPLLPFLEDIKINQVTYKKYAELMKVNFYSNITIEEFNPYPHFLDKKAALIASGPSLNETIHWLKEVEGELELFVVGSALKVVLEHQLKPSAIILSDPKPDIQNQLRNVDYRGPLFYISTSNSEAVQLHRGERYILLQEGYDLAEEVAIQKNFPLIETGGSVSTTAFSLLEVLNFETIFLFGLDLGFKDNRTHANNSTSGRLIQSKELLRNIISNCGDTIYTTPNLNTYLRWFNRKIEKTNLKIYNTALYGAKIQEVPYINKQQFHKLIKTQSL